MFTLSIPPCPAIVVKRIGERCDVKTRSDSPVPYLFRWREETWEVRRVQEVWRKESRWWKPAGAERRTYYRCVAHCGTGERGGHTVVELCLQEKGNRSRWFVARLAD